MNEAEVVAVVHGLLETDGLDAALKYLKDLKLARPPMAAFVTCQIAAVLDCSGYQDRALLAFLEAIDLGAVEAAVSLGNMLSESGDLQGAETWYRWAIERGDSFGMRNLAIDLSRTPKGAREACSYFEQAVEAGDTRSAFLLAACYEEYGETDLAQQWYERALSLGEDDALVGLGLHAARIGSPDEAIDLLRRAIAAGVDGAPSNLAGVLLREGRSDDARTVYMSAVSDGDTSVYLDYANLLAEDGDFQLAEEFYRRAIDDGEFLAWNNLGITLEDRGFTDRALHAYLEGANAGDATALDNYVRVSSNAEPLQ